MYTNKLFRVLIPLLISFFIVNGSFAQTVDKFVESNSNLKTTTLSQASIIELEQGYSNSELLIASADNNLIQNIYVESPSNVKKGNNISEKIDTTHSSVDINNASRVVSIWQILVLAFVLLGLQLRRSKSNYIPMTRN